MLKISIRVYMTKIQRVTKIVDWLIFQGIAKSRKELADLMGYTESSMSQILNEKVPLSDKFIKNLVGVDKNINIDYIVKGTGEMLKSEVHQNNINGDNIHGHNVSVEKSQTDGLIELLRTKDDQINKSQEQISKSQEQIDRLIGLIEKMNNI